MLLPSSTEGLIFCSRQSRSASTDQLNPIRLLVRVSDTMNIGLWLVLIGDSKANLQPEQQQTTESAVWLPWLLFVHFFCPTELLSSYPKQPNHWKMQEETPGEMCPSPFSLESRLQVLTDPEALVSLVFLSASTGK